MLLFIQKKGCSVERSSKCTIVSKVETHIPDVCFKYCLSYASRQKRDTSTLKNRISLKDNIYTIMCKYYEYMHYNNFQGPTLQKPYSFLPSVHVSAEISCPDHILYPIGPNLDHTSPTESYVSLSKSVGHRRSV